MINSESRANHYNKAISEPHQEGPHRIFNLTVSQIVKPEYLNFIEHLHFASHSQCLHGMI
jgi:hypothetical protein